MMKAGNKLVRIYAVPSACILITIILIKLASYFPLWIEKHYSQGVYLYISSFFRILFGWLPFSFGDIFYAIASLFLLSIFFRYVKILFNRKQQQVNYRRTVPTLLIILSTVYIYFNISWGLNYNRPGIAYQLSLDPAVHKQEDLKKITEVLLKKVNETRRALGRNKAAFAAYEQIFEQAQTAYQSTAQIFPFLEYNTTSIKKSMYGRMGNFLGFSGYYNPFTGEAQVNLTQPKFLIPFVSCHEMAHQLGYASESEANFVGYLAAIHSPDTLFHYSAYFDLFNYANRELYFRDSIAAKNNYKRLDPLVKKDEEELHAYWTKSDNAFEPIIRKFYDRYLKANQQVKGVKSYNEVTGWLIAYYNKYGRI
jgi:hypothetical protein